MEREREERRGLRGGAALASSRKLAE